MPYDIIIDVGTILQRVQVKSAWFDSAKQNYVVDNRRTKTNRRTMVRSAYSINDFDYAALYLPVESIFYIMPSGTFISYGSEIHLVEDEKRQRKPRSAAYREAWDLLSSPAERCVEPEIKL